MTPTRPAVLILLAAVVAVPIIAAETRWTLDAAGSEAAGPTTLAGIVGASRLAAGIGWPLLALVWLLKGHSGTPSSDGDYRSGLWFVLLAAMYASTIYLKGFVFFLDTVLLMMLFAGYLWSMLRLRGRPGPSMGGRPEGLFFLAASAVAASLLLIGAAGSEGWASSEAGFAKLSWAVPLIAMTPLIIVVAAAGWSAPSRVGPAVLLITFQMVLLGILIGLLSLVQLFNGDSPSTTGGLELSDAQLSELLLTASQTVFVVAVMVRGNVTAKGPLAILGLFALQTTLGALYPAPVQMALGYLVATLVLVSRDRARFYEMLESLPSARRSLSDGQPVIDAGEVVRKRVE